MRISLRRGQAAHAPGGMIIRLIPVVSGCAPLKYGVLYPRVSEVTDMNGEFLLIDIGNTSIKLAFGGRDGVGPLYALPTKTQYSVDSIGLSLLQILAVSGKRAQDLAGCAICSVVPDAQSLFQKACVRYLHAVPLRFPDDFELHLANGYSRPQEVGADRLLAAEAARIFYPGYAALIVVDYGTATTFDCVSGSEYLGGLICPGLFSSRDALATATSKLPRIALDIKDTVAVIGKNTETSMTHGFLFGFAAMTEGLCERLKKQLPPPVFVVGTGGDAQVLSSLCGAFDAVRPNLLLEGLARMCADR